MTVVPKPVEWSTFSINEYVWDHTWKGPAIVVGSLEEAGRLAVAEIVLPARRLGRVAHRLPSEICRYVRLIVPEDEAAQVLRVVGSSLDFDQRGDPLLTAFKGRLKAVCDARGIELTDAS
jgi:hypothetical protein